MKTRTIAYLSKTIKPGKKVIQDSNQLLRRTAGSKSGKATNIGKNNADIVIAVDVDFMKLP